jgi:branched-chain amino acid transport system ATP-binding protein
VRGDPAPGEGARAEPATATLLGVERLSVSYGEVRAVRDLSLHVEEGEVVALLGPNGAGKSSTLLAIVGLAQPSGGRIVFRGEDITGLPTERVVRTGLTLVPEGRRLFPELTVSENLAIGEVRSNGDRGVVSREELFDLFPVLDKRGDQLAGTLSGGEQQQLAIARALMSSPDLLLLDEPSLGLAPRLAELLFDLIRTLHDRRLTMLLVEQNVSLALQVAQRAYVLASGDLKMEGSSAELLATKGVSRTYLGIGLD